MQTFITSKEITRKLLLICVIIHLVVQYDQGSSNRLIDVRTHTGDGPCECGERCMAFKR